MPIMPSAIPLPGQSLADLYPEIATQWHPTLNGDRRPTEVKAGSNQKVWWQCEHGHAWLAPPVGRKRGEGCPDCAPLKNAIKRSTPKPGKSLANLYPETAADWP